MVTTAPAHPAHPLVELEVTVTGAPDEEEGPVTGARLVYRGQDLQDITVLTTDEEVPYRTDFRLPWPAWLHTVAANHRPPTPEEERHRVADILARAYDGRPLDELREEHAAPHLEAANALLATPHAVPTSMCQCLPFQRYGCGHCRRTDCQNPDCGHCPCMCRCN
ncbi:hypothetical protein GCM10010306_103600 [Streptomyces umbrinus]|uniref:hypothetical protein n=1 Tax=Streptomyces umbrinus TaxID=67370 RepID=UPI0016728C29|nr:hypothetical protein [Streptomyces umbrinus]GHB91661.1 hypothetical protein GCM10010306_103600 [Streptomyces umbrinus]